MKIKLTLIFLFFCLCQTGKAQLIKNGDFETGGIEHWRFSNPSTYNKAMQPGYIYKVDKDTATKNNYAVHISSTGNSNWCQFKQKTGYRPVGTIEKLRLSANVKLVSRNSAVAGISARVLKGQNNMGLFEKSLTGTQEWTTIYADVIVTDKADSLAIFCTMKGEGEIWFDNVRIEKIVAGNMEQSTEAKKYLDTAIRIIANNALHRDSVDFESLVKQARVISADAKLPADCYNAIRYILEGLEDNHSFFQTPEQAGFLNRSEDTSMLLPSGKLINNNIGYLKIPPCMAINAEMERKYADSLKQIIKTIDNKNIIGWVVDDRDNTGGNCWPMLLGLGPVLGDGTFERKTKKGIETNRVEYRNGIVRDRDSVIIKTDLPYQLQRPFPKVALLMNGMTASSGESVALSFKSRPGTKFFGEPSYGLTTANSDFTLSDGAMIFVCSGKQTDRLGNEYGGKIQPDKFVEDNESTKNDEVIDSAVEWLKTK